MPKTYAYKYCAKEKRIAIDTIKYAKPSELTVEEVRGRWIDAANLDYNKHGYNEKTTEPNQWGKWIIRFPAGSLELDNAWNKVIEGIETDTLWEAKVSPKTPGFETQIICVYTTNYENEKEIKEVYDFLINQGINAENIDGYKRDIDTRNNQDIYIYNSACQSTYPLDSQESGLKKQYGKLLKFIKELHMQVCDELNRLYWSQQGKGFFGKKTPAIVASLQSEFQNFEIDAIEQKGLDTLRNFTLDLLHHLIQADSSSSKRDAKTQEFYDIRLEVGLDALAMTKETFPKNLKSGSSSSHSV